MTSTTNKKVILVTGASSGIGKTCVEFLSQKGYKVYGTSRKPATQPGASQMIQMDVNNDASVKKAIGHIVTKEGRLDVVINNAGMGVAGAVEQTSVDETKHQFETNFFGVLRVCQEALPVMRRQQSGYIINVSSIGGLIGIPFQGAYSASKFAVEGLTEVLRMEVKPFGVKVVLVEPGDFNTGFTDSRLIAQQAQETSDYSVRFKSALGVMENDEKNGDKPAKIARLIYKVINQSSPRGRYMVGPPLQKLGVRLKRILPSKWFEQIMMKTYKI